MIGPAERADRTPRRPHGFRGVVAGRLGPRAPLTALLLACVAPSVLAGQETAGPGIDARTDGAPAVFGSAPDRIRVVAAVWALHPFEEQFPEADWMQGFGVQWNQWVFASFRNSYGVRAFTVAVERRWWSTGTARSGAGLGYRVGLVTGYDERLFELARHTPVLPYGGLHAWAAAGPLSLDAFYAYRGITLEAGVNFPL